MLRFPKAVTQFSPGSWRARPFQTTSFSNLFMAGDWYDGAKGGGAWFCCVHCVHCVHCLCILCCIGYTCELMCGSPYPTCMTIPPPFPILTTPHPPPPSPPHPTYRVKGVDHGANGLSQERAYVTGLIAANHVVRCLGQGGEAPILPTEPREPHIAALKEANRAIKGALKSVLPSPLL